MNRTIATTVKLLGIVALAALVFCGCDMLNGLFGNSETTIAERILAFQDELNSASRSQTYLQFHPTATADYNAIKAAAFWETDFPLVGTGTAYAITVTNTNSVSVPAVVTATITGPDDFGGPKTARFTLSKNGSDWMIQGLSLTVGGTTSVVVE